ncbi:MAG: DNA-directed DNA polymerase II small subunit [Methanobacteriota archaeon]|nr:MAG: DNA-directed DNA polymerase II small subunit [Euryarchaeota archaeon]
MRDRLLTFFTEKGTLVEPEAMDRILSVEDPIEFAESIYSNLEAKPLVLTMEDVMKVESVIREVTEEHKVEKEVEEIRPSKGGKKTSANAKDFNSEVKIKKDITGNSTCEGTIKDFQKYFKHRFRTLGTMVKRRREMGGCINIARARKKTTEMRFVCIVNSVRDTKSGHQIVEVEDESDVASVLVLENAIGGENIVPDEVIGVIGKSGRNDLIIADRIIRPDIPSRRAFEGCEDPVSVAFVSDTHVGSNTFMQEKWEKFMAWMNNGDEISSSIKYIVIPGDVVDGIGIYPRQDEELSIHNIYEQYEELVRLLEDVPDHVQIIICPGNHDAVRPAEPQPALPNNIRKLFPSEVMFAGNPCTMTLHDVEVLVYHGRSIDDFIGSVPSLTYENPLESMREMLKKRHVAPTYGGKTPIAPENEDHLVIDTVPDIFVTGHVHWVGVDEYNGVKLVNASAWQSQTSYQKMRNIDPIPAMVPIIDLQTGRARIKEF